jgi:hypothetical protein
MSPALASGGNPGAALPPDDTTVDRESEGLLPVALHELVGDEDAVWMQFDASGSLERTTAASSSSLPPSVPALAWVQLGCAVLAISTAAVAFRELPGRACTSRAQLPHRLKGAWFRPLCP